MTPIDLSASIESLGLTVRSANCLKAEGVDLVGQLIECTEGELLKTQLIDRRAIKDINAALESHGMHLAIVPRDKSGLSGTEIIWLLREIRNELRLMREALEDKR